MGLQTPVCVLFMQYLEKPDLQDVVDKAACEQDNATIDDICHQGVPVISVASKKNICAGDVRLDNIGLTGSKVVICDLGGSKPATCRSVKASITMFLQISYVIFGICSFVILKFMNFLLLMVVASSHGVDSTTGPLRSQNLEREVAEF